MPPARRHDDAPMQLTAEHLKLITEHVTSILTAQLNGAIDGLSTKIDSLKEATRHDFTMMHGRVSGVGDQVQQLDTRINGKIQRLTESVTELEKKERVRHATEGSVAELAAEKVGITRKELATAAATASFIIAFIWGLVEALNKIGPWIAKAMKP